MLSCSGAKVGLYLADRKVIMSELCVDERRLDEPRVGILSYQDVEADPHGVLRRCRAAAPFVGHERGGYVVLRSGDVEALAIDPRLRRIEALHATSRGLTEGALFEGFQYGMISANGAEHRQRRAPFNKAFAARWIAELRPVIRQIAEGLIDGWQAEGEVDLVERFSLHLPVRANARLLGLPESDVPNFTKLIYSISRFLRFPYLLQEQPQIEAAATEWHGYLAELLDARRKGPLDDFLSAYLAEADQKGELSGAEIVAQIFDVTLAGIDPTNFALAVQVALLLQHRAQWEAVCRDRSLIPAAVNEALRYEPGFASLARISTEDIALDGHVLPGGQLVTLSVMSALRDERCYAEPDRFDIHRTDQRRVHLAFGVGKYHCLGETLARVVLEEGLAALMDRFPQLRLAQELPRLQGHIGLRNIAALRVRWSD
jgi:cytochrome P450